MSAGDRDTLAALWAEHRMKFDFRGDMLGCACGDDATWTDTQHRAHLADVLLASDWLTGVKAGAVQAERDRVGPWPGEWVIHKGCDAALEVTHYHVGDRCPHSTTEDDDGVAR